MTFEQSLSTQHRRLFGVGLAMVLGVAVTGYFAGTRQNSWSPMAAPEGQPRAAAGEVLPGETYLERRARRHGPSSKVTSVLDRFRRAGPKIGDPVEVSREGQEQAVAKRGEARGFDGAPPVVPHPIDEQSAHSCITCHREGLWIEGRRAPVMSHRFLDNCTACHVPSAPRHFGQERPMENFFVGLASTGPGERAWEDAPPTIPHSVYMRETCAGCHGLNGMPGLRTSHPELGSCIQCHAPAQSELPWQR